MAHSILMIEAGAGSGASVRPALAALDFEVTVAESCRSSHAILDARDDFHLALVDYHPHAAPAHAEVCGLDCDYLRSRRLPFVVMSERHDRDVVKASVDAGALGFIPKSAGPEFILPVMATAVARCRTARAEGLDLAHVRDHRVEARDASRDRHVMERYRLTDNDAARLLRYFARSHRISLDEAADRIMSKAGSLDLLAAAHRFVQRFVP
jgi:AmiR/NasT family two-component response regulator